jgi:homoserine O-acetyltransferase/O-succinyltransferase
MGEGVPALVLHGTAGSAGSMITPAFAGELFGPGQPLDATKYYIVIPDALGHGRSSKPSDGLKAKFPQYDYADMVDAQYRLLSEVSWYPTREGRHRQLDGRDACLGLGRKIS